jgi:Fe-S-cluster containining protein
MPDGKPAGVPCIHLTADLRCDIYSDPRRPAVCGSFPAVPDHCGSDREEACRLLAELEELTK